MVANGTALNTTDTGGGDNATATAAVWSTTGVVVFFGIIFMWFLWSRRKGSLTVNLSTPSAGYSRMPQTAPPPQPTVPPPPSGGQQTPAKPNPIKSIFYDSNLAQTLLSSSSQHCRGQQVLQAIA